MRTSEQVEVPESTRSDVKRWTAAIRKAKSQWAPDYERMRQNMDFAAGFQWSGQDEMDCPEYVANMTIRTVNQKVASLYARNPKAVFRRRPRLYYQVWDERLETLALAIQAASGGDLGGMAIVNDYQNGQRMQRLVERVGQTLELLYQHQVDRQEPEFKEQMKQLVRRVVIAGVGFVRVSFVREAAEPLDDRPPLAEMSKRAIEILTRIQDGEVEKDDADVERLRLLFASLDSGLGRTAADFSERLVFDFPPPTSVIIDPACRALKGFVGARWVAQEYILPLDEVNAFFETDIQPGGDLVEFSEGDQDNDVLITRPGDPAEREVRVRVWEVFDKTTQSRMFLCEGWPTYLMEPQPMTNRLSRFWPIFPLTFNDVEVEGDNNKATIYPPSDVQLLKAAQREWNRTRNELRQHRRSNRPKYVTGQGWLSPEDLDKLEGCPSSAILQLQGVPPNASVGDLLRPLEHAPIDPTLYDVKPLQLDILMATGMQEANLGPLSSGTATEASISEQSRLSATGSNVDDLDDLLSNLARAGGELLIQGMGEETVKRIVGPGAVWPQTGREEFLNEVFLEVEAASSGRPNKAVEVANFERMAPVLLQAGANPSFLVREGVKRLDDRLDVNEAFPLMAGGGPQAVQAPNGGQNAEGSQPKVENRQTEQPNPRLANGQQSALAAGG